MEGEAKNGWRRVGRDEVGPYLALRASELAQQLNKERLAIYCGSGEGQISL